MSVPLAAEGEFALSRAQLEQALGKWFPPRSERILVPGGDHDLYTWLADIAAQQGDAAALADYAPRAAEAAALSGHRLYAAIAERALAVAERLNGQPAQAEARLARALAVFTDLGTPWQAGRTRFELGTAAQAQGALARARDYYAAALRDFEQLGAAPMASRTRERLAALADKV